jgi:hypothetical protein
MPLVRPHQVFAIIDEFRAPDVLYLFFISRELSDTFEPITLRPITSQKEFP